jgi:hypothetical protein
MRRLYEQSIIPSCLDSCCPSHIRGFYFEWSPEDLLANSIVVGLWLEFQDSDRGFWGVGEPAGEAE